MLNRKIIYIITLISLIILTIYLVNNETNNKSTISDNNIFHVNDTSTIARIFLSDREGNSINLVRHQNDWIVNKKYTVKKSAINTILSTINKIRIKTPVSNIASKNVIKYIATTGINVEIFSQNRMIKSYIIGSSTPDHLGTYMIMKNIKKPYIIHIPTFNGFLSPRYGIQNNRLNENTWRSTRVFDLKPNEIEQIKYSDLLNPNNSYLLIKEPTTLLDYSNNKTNYNDNAVQKLLNSFEKLNCEAYKEKKHKIDFIQLEELIVNSDTLRTYRISDSIIKRKEDNFTVERKLATINNGDLMLIQDYVFNKVLVTINEIKK